MDNNTRLTKLFQKQLEPRQLTKVIISTVVALSEVRVFFAMYALSGSILTGILSTLGTGAWFFLWYHSLTFYPLAGELQKKLSRTMSIVGLVMSALFAIVDLQIKVIGQELISLEAIIFLLAMSQVINILAAMLWLSRDGQLWQQELLAQKRAQADWDVEVLTLSVGFAKQAERALEIYKGLLDKYGAQALEALGIEAPILPVEETEETDEIADVLETKEVKRSTTSKPKAPERTQKAPEPRNAPLPSVGPSNVGASFRERYRLEPKKNRRGVLIGYNARSRSGRADTFYISKAETAPNDWAEYHKVYMTQKTKTTKANKRRQ